TYWYSTDSHRYLVKFDAGGVVAELSAVRQPAHIVLQPPPWLDGEEMQLDAKVAGAAAGTMRYSVKAGQTNGQSIWHLLNDSTPGGRARRLVEVRADTFAPIHSHVETGGNVVDTTYWLDHAEIKSSGGGEIRKVTLDSSV